MVIVGGGEDISRTSSCLPFVISSMNNLRGQIRSFNFLSSLTFPMFRSSTGIPGCINTYINAYYGMVGSLLNSITEETKAIKSMAEVYEVMETNIKSQQL